MKPESHKRRSPGKNISLLSLLTSEQQLQPTKSVLILTVRNRDIIEPIEEYLRPARLVEKGSIITRPALSECVQIDLPQVGTLEAFNSDGLRTLCDTLSVPNMRERTLRYPGHVEKMLCLRDAGFFSEQPIQINGESIRPLDMTVSILIESWKYEQGEADLTVMQVEAEGTLGEEYVRLCWDLLDYYDPKADQSSMARTTGFPAAAMGRMIVDGTIDNPGVHPPETFGNNDSIVNRLLAELEERNVKFINFDPHPRTLILKIGFSNLVIS